ncbi:MAG TPA: ActS/PrrB/RegB family redox-sensitive histidine kinase [Thermohalobaculum sp.]|nr:ActS/PrrB/RegB family redox-sensitive histidine kinase [Thermohalobaculum sp.]
MKRRRRHYLFNLEARGDWVRLRTLVALRWLAVAGQTIAVLAASQGMGFQLPLVACALLISALASVNIVAHLIFPSEKRLSEQGTLLSLFFDLAQLVTLLMVTGGLNNPFAVLIIGPVTISATALRLQSTLWLGIAGMASVTLMASFHMPLVQADGTVFETPELFRSGVAAALAIAIAFLAVYARRVTVEGYAMSQALTAAQIALAREQRLAAIGGIAAATAHELGTPLATIKLVASELARDLKGNPEAAEDLALIRHEAERCGEILADLSRGGRDDTHIHVAPISAIAEEAAAPHSKRGKNVVIRVDGALASEPGNDQPQVERSPELVHGLRNLIQNAVDFATRTVWVDIDIGDAEIRIAVGDDGPGFPPDLMPRLGEPYVSTRRRGVPRDGDEEDNYEGMGLGLFIARTLLQRTGAQVTFANGSDYRMRQDTSQNAPAELAHPPGAIIELIWPVASLVTPKEVARGPLGRNRRFGARS